MPESHTASSASPPLRRPLWRDVVAGLINAVVSVPDGLALFLLVVLRGRCLAAFGLLRVGRVVRSVRPVGCVKPFAADGGMAL